MSTVTTICTNHEEIAKLSEIDLDAAHAKVHEKVLESTLQNLHDSQ